MNVKQMLEVLQNFPDELNVISYSSSCERPDEIENVLGLNLIIFDRDDMLPVF